jgi:hypothetical protein
MRDKLIELIKYGLLCPNMNTPFGGACDTCQYAEAPECDHARLADHLIANGVTFADVPDNNVGKWIPVSERLPERAMAITGKRTCSSSDEVLVYVERTGVILIAEYWHDGGFWEEPEENQTVWDVTHWMPLPSVEGLNDT